MNRKLIVKLHTHTELLSNSFLDCVLVFRCDHNLVYIHTYIHILNNILISAVCMNEFESFRYVCRMGRKGVDMKRQEKRRKKRYTWINLSMLERDWEEKSDGMQKWNRGKINRTRYKDKFRDSYENIEIRLLVIQSFGRRIDTMISQFYFRSFHGCLMINMCFSTMCFLSCSF